MKIQNAQGSKRKLHIDRGKECRIKGATDWQENGQRQEPNNQIK